MNPPETALNESQQQRLIVTCRHVDGLLADIEHAFEEARAKSTFNRYDADLSPADQRLVGDYISRIRHHLVGLLAGQGLSPGPSRISLRHALLTALTFIDIAADELEPRYMRGYGEVAPGAASALDGIVEDLHDVIGQLRRSLSTDRVQDIGARIGRAGGGQADRLKRLQGLVDKYGLVEFRTGLAAALDTVERHGLELGIFGRVSSGKSSLLNRLVGGDVLPVGVNPITAVPTRLRYGPRPLFHVTIAGAPARSLELEQLQQYLSERENPANSKRVSRLIVELPSPLLASGITLVDTPGIGSLAAAGESEALAYLPYCDVAAVLVDAATTLSAQDLTIIGLLLRAGIPVSVLLSKADLISDRDREAALAYVGETLEREFQRPLPVTAVSVKHGFEALFQNWHQQQLAPLILGQNQRRQQAAAAKIDRLRAQIEATLRALAARRAMSVAPTAVSASGVTSAAPDLSAPAAAVTPAMVLQEASGFILSLERRLREWSSELTLQMPAVFRQAAVDILHGGEARDAVRKAFGEVAARTALQMTQGLEKLADALNEVLVEIHGQRPAVPDSMELIQSGVPFHERPVPELPDFVIPKLHLMRLLGRRMAEHQVAGRLQAAAGGVVKETLQGYAAVLLHWAFGHLHSIRGQWIAVTDALRAQLDGQRSELPDRDAVQHESLMEDIDSLASGWT